MNDLKINTAVPDGLAADARFLARSAGPFCTALVISVGIAVAWGCLLGWSLQAVNRRDLRYFESVNVTPDGTPLISRTYMGTPQRTDYFTLDRKPAPAHDLSAISAATVAKGPARSAVQPWLEEPLILAYSDCREQMTAWYFVVFGNPGGNGYFVGYDVATRHRAGFIGREGFQAIPPALRQTFAVNRMPGFAATFIAPFLNHQQGDAVFWYGSGVATPGTIPAWICHVVSGDRLFRIDLRKRTVETVLELPGLISVSMAQRPRKQADPQADRSQDYEECLVVRSQAAVTVVDWKDRVERTYRLPDELKSVAFNFYPAANGRAVATYNDPPRSGRHLNSLNVIQFSPDGTISGKAFHATDTPGVRENPAATAWMSLIVPAPIVPLVVTFVVAPFRVGDADSSSPGYVAAMAEAWGVFWPMLLVTGILGVVSVALYRRRAARYGNRPTAAWTAFIFLCGVPGLLGYLLHRRWPVRVACPACRADAPRDRDHCVLCGRLFPSPEPNGREIFA